MSRRCRPAGGPSVRPYQPEGLWKEIASTTDYKQSQGEDLYRRSLYTYWKRTSPYPSMTTFDAPNREICTVRRVRTNTPLQALVTLNDPVFIEAAQALARRMAAHGNSPEDQIRYGFRLCLARNPDRTGEVATLKEVLEEGDRALIVGRADEERVVELGDALYLLGGRTPNQSTIPGDSTIHGDVWNSDDGGVTWTGTFTPTDDIEDTSNVISVGTTLTDLDGNAPLAGASTANYAIDTTEPVVSSVTMSDSALKVGETSTLTITFSEAVTNFDNSDITLENGKLVCFKPGN